jgi:hypothetical protein
MYLLVTSNVSSCDTPYYGNPISIPIKLPISYPISRISDPISDNYI